MEYLSWVAVSMIVFAGMLATTLIAVDLFSKGIRTPFVWFRLGVLVITVVWYTILGLGLVPVPISWPSIVSRFLVVLYVVIVFYDRFHIT
jgi:hypothetical protein